VNQSRGRESVADARAFWAVGGALALGMVACRGTPEGQPGTQAAQSQVPAATAAPGFTQQIEAVPRESIVAYGRRLSFDTSHAGSDAQHLVARRAGRLVTGPYARIAPEASSHRLARGDLARGRVVARIDSEGPYLERGIPTGVSYVWIDSSASGWRSVLVPEDVTQPMAEKPLRLVRHTRSQPVQEEPAQARWSWSVEGERMGECIWCPPWDWCQTQSSAAVRLIR